MEIIDLTNINWENKQNYDEFLLLIKDLSKKESTTDAIRHAKILNTKQKIYAMKMSDMRKIAKLIVKSDVLNFLNIAQDNSYEEITIQGLVIAQIKDLQLQTKLLTDWVAKIDNWSSCDTVVSTMKSLKTSKEKFKYFEHYKNMCFSKKEFTARFGIVCLMVNYLEDTYIDDILTVCKQVNHDGYYVKMAIAWLLSFAFIKFHNKTYTLLEQKRLDKFIQNKAICKCRDSFQVSEQDKEALVKLRIK